MKKMLLITGIFISNLSLACDICGCGVGSYYIGILPEFSKKIIGLRYRYNTLHTHIGAGGLNTYLTTKEIYRTTEVWTGWTIGKKFRIMGYLPVGFNEKMNQGNSTSKTGLGDIGVQGFYQVLNSRGSMAEKLLVQSLWVGAGIKIPTGKYDAEEKNNNLQNANIFQLGSGSTDCTINAMYNVRLQDAGLNTAVSYKINTENKQQYRYGNKFSANAQAYYKFRVLNKFTVAPNTGLLYEKSSRDNDKGYVVDLSGGHVLMGTMGMEVSLKRMAVGANWQRPLSQDLAGGFVKANDRTMVHVAFMF